MNNKICVFGRYTYLVTIGSRKCDAYLPVMSCIVFDYSCNLDENLFFYENKMYILVENSYDFQKIMTNFIRVWNVHFN